MTPTPRGLQAGAETCTLSHLQAMGWTVLGVAGKICILESSPATNRSEKKGKRESVPWWSLTPGHILAAGHTPWHTAWHRGGLGEEGQREKDARAVFRRAAWSTPLRRERRCHRLAFPNF